jgi:hypothetical protein
MSGSPPHRLPFPSRPVLEISPKLHNIQFAHRDFELGCWEPRCRESGCRESGCRESRVADRDVLPRHQRHQLHVAPAAHQLGPALHRVSQGDANHLTRTGIGPRRWTPAYPFEVSVAPACCTDASMCGLGVRGQRGARWRVRRWLGCHTSGFSTGWCRALVQADVRACAGWQLRLRAVKVFPCAG